ncbi:hypothetical protein CBR_g66803 [Chara braunii]|uniref:Uncharacterized protein n=1 Tax=Chara braunii TaxID=69332 RepID=A0A388K9D7_CHABU|nr:hypothetical protein CBR_g66803 [Chara braunii]|eukprot:GBG66668.1 hypothetical protein CBR_g66803 [Chara braunii]
MVDYHEENLLANEQSVVCISPHASDRLRVYNLTEAGIERLTSAVNASWRAGIQSVRNWNVEKVYEFQLRGRPWLGSGGDAISARRLVVGVFRCMLEMGYGLALSAITSRKPDSKDAWVFLRRTTKTKWQCSNPHDVFAISFNLWDTVRVIDAGEEGSGLVRELLECHWAKGIQKVDAYKGVPQIKLRGNPWQASSGSESTASRVLVAQLVAGLAEAGYTVYASIALTSQDRGDSETQDYDQIDSWIVIKNPPPSLV